MNELQPLDIIDDRSLEQIRADGDDRWPSGAPYIVQGVCAVCGAVASQDHDCLVKLATPGTCEIETDMDWTRVTYCGQPAYWRLNGVATCDADIKAIAEMSSDNATWLASALADIAARKVGKE